MSVDILSCIDGTKVELRYFVHYRSRVKVILCVTVNPLRPGELTSCQPWDG